MHQIKESQDCLKHLDYRVLARKQVKRDGFEIKAYLWFSVFCLRKGRGGVPRFPALARSLVDCGIIIMFNVEAGGHIQYIS